MAAATPRRDRRKAGENAANGVLEHCAAHSDVAYGYDQAMQLTSEVRTGGAAYEKHFYYDAAGNRTKKSENQVDTLYVYNNADQLTNETTGAVTTSYLYDANGALTRSDDGEQLAQCTRRRRSWL